MCDDVAAWSSRAAVNAIRDRRISVSEYARCLLGRCAEESLGAFVSCDEGAVLDAAAQADRADRRGPLHGVLIAVKDNVDVAGHPTTAGTPALRAHRPGRDAEIWRRLRAAGALALGKTNMHELAVGITGNNPGFGPVRNPWAADRFAGGSSSGSAAAVAAFLAPAGLGTDTGGSVRIPAALCAVFGYRPSAGRYPQRGLLLLSRTRDTAGFLTRTMRDIVLLDSVVAAPGPAPEPVRWAGLRLGVPRRPFWEGLEPSLAAVAERRLEELSAAGAVLVEATLPAGAGASLARDAMTVALYEAAWEIPYYLAQTSPAPTLDQLLAQIASPGVRAAMNDALGPARVPAADYRAACENLSRLAGALSDHQRAHRLSALVYPTTPLPAQPFACEESVVIDGREHPTFPTFIRNTDWAGVLGLPALSLPAGLTADGLPVGLELCAPAGADAHLLQMGCAYEEIWPPPALEPATAHRPELPPKVPGR
ncbi:amidase family protein [Nonomuraea sp. NPDC001831]|uniref:amidase family protein n=1 Tax=Nonomuraea sp. NPDC001831 TaxID=3364340 RepID=UPI0036A26D55